MAKIDDTIARITYEQLYRIMDDIRERHYTHIKKMIAEEVQSLGKRCRHFHVEVDLWDEETNKRHYACILLNWVDKDYQHRCVCLDFKLWEGSANGPRLKHYIYEVLDEWDLSDLLDDVTSDAGSNMRNALEDFDWNRCVAHNINNAMDVALGARFHIRGRIKFLPIQLPMA